MTGKHRLTKSIKRLDIDKQDQFRQVRGILGLNNNGVNQVEIPSRPGYVWVRLRDNLSEVIQAYNSNVSPVYDLPVFVTRDSDDPTRYIVQGRDIAQYANWGAGSAYLPRHSNQHSFSDDAGAAGDVVWVYGRQFMPFLGYPSGSAGAGNIIISPYTFYSQNNIWKYAGNTGTADILAYKPTDNTARVVLVYVDANGNPQLSPGSYFSTTLTGTSQIINYLPSLPSGTFPISAVRLVSGTSVINWSNLHDLRPFYSESIAVLGGGGTGGGITERAIPIYNNHIFKVTGTAIDFTDNMSVAVTGSVAFVSSAGGTGTSSSSIGARVYRTSNFSLVGGSWNYIPFTDERWDTDNIHSGSSTQLFCNTAGTYLIVGQGQFTENNIGTRYLNIRLNGTTEINRINQMTITGSTTNMSISTIYQLGINDYVEFGMLYDISLASLNATNTANKATEFMMQKIA